MYSLDTSFFMDWQARFYPVDVFRSLERRIEQIIDAGECAAVANVTTTHCPRSPEQHQICGCESVAVEGIPGFDHQLNAGLGVAEMRTAELSELNGHCHHLLFADSESDRLEVNKPSVNRCGLHRVGLKYAKFTEGNIVHTVFEEAYLRNAAFIGVVLTGTYFIRCNLPALNTNFRWVKCLIYLGREGCSHLCRGPTELPPRRTLDFCAARAPRRGGPDSVGRSSASSTARVSISASPLRRGAVLQEPAAARVSRRTRGQLS